MANHLKDQILILASASPRRLEIAKVHGYSPLVIPSKAKESLPETMNPSMGALCLALKKALAVEAELLGKPYGGGNITSINGYPENPIILGADTVVAFEGAVIGKPESREVAFRNLAMLRGKRHTVITGVALIKAGLPIRRCFTDTSEVFFGEYSDKEILDYINTEEPYDKAGGYAIQGTWGKYVKTYVGDLENIIGLPWKKVEDEFSSMFFNV